MKPLIIANWKMNPQTLAEAKQLFNSVKKGIKNIKNVEVVICPPFNQFSIFNFQFSKNLKLGAQNVFWENSGAFTGEISPIMLKDSGCEYVIVGHSERRKLGESDEMINKKIKAVLKVKLKPILCVGETERERKEGKTPQVLKNQLRQDLKGIENLKFKIENLIIAYEPIWAIGTGNPCLPKEAKKIFLFLRNLFKKTKILYGGSVKAQNAVNYIKKAGFDGLLIGGASLDPKEFIQIIKNVSQS